MNRMTDYIVEIKLKPKQAHKFVGICKSTMNSNISCDIESGLLSIRSIYIFY